jgi:hypothetical protein
METVPNLLFFFGFEFGMAIEPSFPGFRIDFTIYGDAIVCSLTNDDRIFSASWGF